ncbi:MAG: dihydropteroate synthase [Clostridia bacterium]|nr:dihydropteroate synthase [Clostridia bacterium]
MSCIKRVIKIGNSKLEMGKRTYIMGILNVTPDSFSDGGKYIDLDKAVEHALNMVKDGADIIDIGGESTRPNSSRVDLCQEVRRVIPVVEKLVKAIDIPISVDTYKAEVARLALEQGAHMINDVSGLKEDKDMAEIVAQYRVPVCIMHDSKIYHHQDVIYEIVNGIRESLDIAFSAGIDPENIILDPGIGFGKDWKQNIMIMRRFEELCKLDYPLLLGTSRKSFIGKTLDVPVDQRLEGTLATVCVGITKGADIVRVHDVKQVKRLVDMTDAMVRRC